MLFAVEHSPEVKADILVMAKGIAADFPLGAFTAREPLSDATKPGDHLSTFGGNTISCAAALASIAVLEEERLVENAARRGDQLPTRFRVLIGDVRGRGMMIGVGGALGNVLRIQLPLSITEEECQCAADALEQALATPSFS
jgi:4-aminobutyrate aminotransferase-like enzyme